MTIVVTLLVMSLTSFFLCGIDKYFSIKNKFRIEETLLLIVSLLGGSFGFLLGMYIFHHKTKKKKFYILIPTLCILHLILIITTIYNK